MIRAALAAASAALGVPVPRVTPRTPALRTPIALPVENVFKTGRNEPCPCGSGLKFKRCHGV